MFLEDWRRDLTKNSATTDDEARDINQRPLATDLPPEQLRQLFIDASETLRGWRHDRTEEQEGRVIVLHFVRTTRLLRFQDDIDVTITPLSDPRSDRIGSLATATSKSRVGKADFGQNPRNLRELFGAVRGLWKRTSTGG